MYYVLEYDSVDSKIITVSQHETYVGAKRLAKNLARKVYGSYVEKIKFENTQYICAYSDWAIGLDGVFDSVIFAVYKPDLIADTHIEPVVHGSIMKCIMKDFFVPVINKMISTIPA